jgi:hypothetical protein
MIYWRRGGDFVIPPSAFGAVMGHVGGDATARIPRKCLIETGAVDLYHCINRCVRQAFLCGTDVVSGKNYDRAVMGQSVLRVSCRRLEDALQLFQRRQSAGDVTQRVLLEGQHPFLASLRADRIGVGPFGHQFLDGR